MSRIHFFEKGEGQPLVLIHGFCETSRMWTDFAEKLAKDFRVICPDLPGIGDSPISGEQISLEEVAVMLEEWMDTNEIHQPIVIGHSLGGYVTLALLELIGPHAQSEFFVNPQVDFRVAISTLIVLVVAGALAGFVPAYRAAQIKPIVALRDE